MQAGVLGIAGSFLGGRPAAHFDVRGGGPDSGGRKPAKEATGQPEGCPARPAVKEKGARRHMDVKKPPIGGRPPHFDRVSTPGHRCFGDGSILGDVRGRVKRSGKCARHGFPNWPQRTLLDKTL
ncbi:hypothetical protein MAFF211479_11040 [Ralstonia solanacearum]|nr:hypothetical protein MAFF211479_11040 [Ralstonia solanacearum]BCN03966.1 hypothetical protein RPSB_11030 [Ralstonia solanacearum]